ncbi:hypothetical protein KEM54_001691 [Ascosphaera aggregata]|nr:hypothetical protein KEM54_001691 [Ascosphaera aggregata]
MSVPIAVARGSYEEQVGRIRSHDFRKGDIPPYASYLPHQAMQGGLAFNIEGGHTWETNAALVSERYKDDYLQGRIDMNSSQMDASCLPTLQLYAQYLFGYDSGVMTSVIALERP